MPAFFKQQHDIATLAAAAAALASTAELKRMFSYQGELSSSNGSGNAYVAALPATAAQAAAADGAAAEPVAVAAPAAAAAAPPALAAAPQDPAAAHAWQPLPAAPGPAELERQLQDFLNTRLLPSQQYAQLVHLVADNLCLAREAQDPEQQLANGQARVVAELTNLVGN